MKIICISIASVLLICGCSATVKGVQQDSKEAYGTIKGALHEGAEWVGEKTGK
jgi:uncharacterized protein YceK